MYRVSKYSTAFMHASGVAGMTRVTGLPSFLFTAHVTRFGLAGVEYSNISLFHSIRSFSFVPPHTVHVKAVNQDNVSCRQPNNSRPIEQNTFNLLCSSLLMPGTHHSPAIAPPWCEVPNTRSYVHSHSPEIHGSLFTQVQGGICEG